MSAWYTDVYNWVVRSAVPPPTRRRDSSRFQEARVPAATLATVERWVTSPSRFAIAPAALTYEMPIFACTVAPRRASNPTHAPEPRPARSAPVR